jgi:hypothetical protein
VGTLQFGIRASSYNIGAIYVDCTGIILQFAFQGLKKYLNKYNLRKKMVGAFHCQIESSNVQIRVLLEAYGHVLEV